MAKPCQEGGFPGPAVITQVEGQKLGLRPFQPGGDIDQVRVHGEMGQAAAEGKERLFGSRSNRYCRIGILDVLAGQRILQLGGERWAGRSRNSDQIQAVLVLQAVVELAADRKKVGGVELAVRLVQPAGRAEVGELELAAVALDPLAAARPACRRFSISEVAVSAAGRRAFAPCSFLNFSHSLGWVA